MQYTLFMFYADDIYNSKRKQKVDFIRKNIMGNSVYSVDYFLDKIREQHGSE